MRRRIIDNRQGSKVKGPETDLVVELAVDGFAVVIDQLEGVRAVAIHVAVAVGKPSVTEQEGNLQGNDVSECDLLLRQCIYLISLSLVFKVILPGADSRVSGSRSPTPCPGPSCGFEGSSSGSG